MNVRLLQEMFKYDYKKYFLVEAFDEVALINTPNEVLKQIQTKIPFNEVSFGRIKELLDVEIESNLFTSLKFAPFQSGVTIGSIKDTRFISIAPNGDFLAWLFDNQISCFNTAISEYYKKYKTEP